MAVLARLIDSEYHEVYHILRDSTREMAEFLLSPRGEVLSFSDHRRLTIMELSSEAGIWTAASGFNNAVLLDATNQLQLVDWCDNVLHP